MRQFPNTTEGIQQAITATPVDGYWEARVAWHGTEHAKTDAEVADVIEQARREGADVGNVVARNQVAVVDVPLPEVVEPAVPVIPYAGTESMADVPVDTTGYTEPAWRANM